MLAIGELRIAVDDDAAVAAHHVDGPGFADLVVAYGISHLLDRQAHAGHGQLAGARVDPCIDEQHRLVHAHIMVEVQLERFAAGEELRQPVVLRSRLVEHAVEALLGQELAGAVRRPEHQGRLAGFLQLLGIALPGRHAFVGQAIDFPLVQQGVIGQAERHRQRHGDLAAHVVADFADDCRQLLLHRPFAQPLGCQGNAEDGGNNDEQQHARRHANHQFGLDRRVA